MGHNGAHMLLLIGLSFVRIDEKINYQPHGMSQGPGKTQNKQLMSATQLATRTLHIKPKTTKLTQSSMALEKCETNNWISPFQYTTIIPHIKQKPMELTLWQIQESPTYPTWATDTECQRSHHRRQEILWRNRGQTHPHHSCQAACTPSLELHGWFGPGHS